MIGLSYVGMPIAVAFAKKIQVIGFDSNKAKIDLYKIKAEKLVKGAAVAILGFKETARTLTTAKCSIS